MTELSSAGAGTVPCRVQRCFRLALFMVGCGAGVAYAEIDVDALRLDARVTQEVGTSASNVTFTRRQNVSSSEPAFHPPPADAHLEAPAFTPPAGAPGDTG